MLRKRLNKEQLLYAANH